MKSAERIARGKLAWEIVRDAEKGNAQAQLDFWIRKRKIHLRKNDLAKVEDAEKHIAFWESQIEGLEWQD